ncbi:MAG: AbrB/MazE/SpoVT family DNA-binding domain-containing protein [Bacillota bacterium]
MITLSILRGSDFYGAATVGERGQIVIPAEARKRYGIEIGDKLMVFGRHHGGGLILMKAELVTKIVTTALSELSGLEKILSESEPKPDQE